MDSIRGWGILFGVIITATTAIAADDRAGISTDARSHYLEAASAAQRGDYVIAYSIWRPLADQGDADSQYALGWMYHNGYGLVSDDQAARAWWEHAIAQGHTDAMFALGTLYSVGSETIARDYTEAMRLWLQAAAAGHENAGFAVRELLHRNLPELASLTRTLRAQYPQLLGKTSVTVTSKGSKARQARNMAVNKMTAEFATVPEQQSGFTYSGELIAVAAGYRPEYGWAAVQLIKEGELLFADLR